MIGSKANDILIFISVVDTGSFVAGGKAFGLTRSTAGKAVARLEESYGARLLNRTTRSLALTEEGQSLYEHGIAIRKAIEAADECVVGEPGIPHGKLRITAPDAIGRHLLLPTVKQYLALWPHVQVEISFSDRINNLIEEGFDLAIRIGKTVPQNGLIARTLTTLDSVLCASPSYFQGRTRPKTVEQLSRHNLLQFSNAGDRQGWRLQEQDGTWVNAQGYTRLRLDSASALRDAALIGMGIVELPRILVSNDLVAKRLEHVLPQTNCGAVPIMALFPHKRFLEPRVRQFLDMLIGTLGRM